LVEIRGEFTTHDIMNVQALDLTQFIYNYGLNETGFGKGAGFLKESQAVAL